MLAGGFGSAVTEWLSDNGITTPVKRLGIGDEFVEHGTVAQLRTITGTDHDSIRRAITGADDTPAAPDDIQ